MNNYENPILTSNLKSFFVVIFVVILFMYPDFEKSINRKVSIAIKLASLMLILFEVYQKTNHRDSESFDTYSENDHCELIPKKIKKRKVSEKTKKIVASNQKWKCNICSELLSASYEVDHINPLFKGGSNEIDNLQALCRNCHGNKTISDME
jgi:hypothetical protein